MLFATKAELDVKIFYNYASPSDQAIIRSYVWDIYNANTGTGQMALSAEPGLRHRAGL